MNESLFSPPPGATPAGNNNPVLSVSDLAGAIKRTLESDFGRVRVRGEISRPNYHASGHLYFTLKDDRAVIEAACWRTRLPAIKLRAEEGLEVIVTGRVSSYPGSSKYQIVVDEMELAGEGAILKLLEQRRRALAAEGLFDAKRKKPIPYLPSVIGVITSPTGAVIRDILHRLSERFPRRVLLWPVRVQGEGAAAEVAAAIAGFNRLAAGGAVPRPDVLIVARGGGSLEDLWAFNEEIVVRAAAASLIPLISAVGHETDTTLIDHAADHRAPTPTAAAERAVPVRAELTTLVATCGSRLAGSAERVLRERRNEVAGLARGLPEPRRLLEEAWQRLDERSERLGNCARAFLRERLGRVSEWATRLPHPRQQLALATERLEACGSALDRVAKRFVERHEQPFRRLDADRRLRACATQRLADAGRALEHQARLLESVSHQKVLERGFALVEADGRLATRADAVPAGAALTLTFADGKVAARADGVKPKAKPRDPAEPSKQGTLL